MNMVREKREALSRAELKTSIHWILFLQNFFFFKLVVPSLVLWKMNHCYSLTNTVRRTTPSPEMNVIDCYVSPTSLMFRDTNFKLKN